MLYSETRWTMDMHYGTLHNYEPHFALDDITHSSSLTLFNAIRQGKGYQNLYFPRLIHI